MEAWETGGTLFAALYKCGQLHQRLCVAVAFPLTWTKEQFPPYFYFFTLIIFANDNDNYLKILYYIPMKCLLYIQFLSILHVVFFIWLSSSFLILLHYL